VGISSISRLTTARGDGRRRPGTTRAAKRQRQRHILDIVAANPIASQHEFVDLLAKQGYTVTQATVSRDIAELGLVKVQRDGRHVYATAGVVVAVPMAANDDRLTRALADYPVTVGRSGLTLLLVSDAGTAPAIGQAIDESTLDSQEGTLAGDNTVLVLFSDESRLRRWRLRFDELLASAAAQR
jgi:transcriptional regulator of arginine metabolism